MIHTDGRPTIAMRESDRQHSVKVTTEDFLMNGAANSALSRVADAIEAHAADGRMTNIDEAVAFMRAVAARFA